jgi:uncharacterized NAD-dependent epimerase/dehydratase family protein
MLVLTEGQLGVFTAKTGVVVLRYRGQDVVGVLDSAYAGQPLSNLVPGVVDVPIVASVAEGMALKPDAVLIGIAPVGGALPDRMRRHVVEALENGLSIVSGLHTLLNADEELADLAKRSGARIHDVRDPGAIDRIAHGRARRTKAKRVLTVGTDCVAGKMVTALELRKAAVAAGLDAAFVATGQTGVMIEGWGIAVDHVLSDFAAGAAEMLAEREADREIQFIEGQGSIEHPGYSGVSLSLLHGTCPDAMVMCHRPGRELHHEEPDCPITPINQQIALCEQLLAPLHPGKVVAASVNTAGMTDDEAAEAVRALAGETGLPAVDPIRMGCDELLAAVRTHLGV